jgi:hypothetical protein
MNKIKLPRFDGELDGELEKNYRRHSLPANIKQATIGIIIFLIPAVLFIINDYAVLGLKPILFYVTLFRLLFLIYGILIIYSLRRVKEPASYDLLILSFCLFGIALITFINYTRPIAYLGRTYVDLIVLLLIYVGIPTKLFFRFAAAVLFTLGCVILVALSHDFISLANTIAIIFSLVAVNLGGLLLSHRLYSYQRKQFVAHIEIMEDIHELKQAHEDLNSRNTLLSALINSPRDMIIFSLDKDLR